MHSNDFNHNISSYANKKTMAPKGPPPGYINPRLVSDKLHPDHPYSLANYKKRQSERMKEAMVSNRLRFSLNDYVLTI